MADSPDSPAGELLEQLKMSSCERFTLQRTILSFPEYIDLVLEDPTRHTRNCALYLRDLLDHFKGPEKDLRDELVKTQSFKGGLDDKFVAAIKQFSADWVPPGA